MVHHARYIFYILYHALSSILCSFGPAAEQVVVQLLISDFSSSTLRGRLFRLLDPPVPTTTGLYRLIQPSINIFPSLISHSVSSPTIVPFPVLPRSLVSPPPEPPVVYQGFLESACQMETDIVVYVEEPSITISAEGLALMKLLCAGSVLLFVALGAFVHPTVADGIVARGLPRSVMWLWIIVKNRFLAGLNALPGHPGDLFFHTHTTESLGLLSDDQVKVTTPSTTVNPLASSQGPEHGRVPSSVPHSFREYMESLAANGIESNSSFEYSVTEADEHCVETQETSTFSSTSSPIILLARHSVNCGKQTPGWFPFNTPALSWVSVKDSLSDDLNTLPEPPCGLVSHTRVDLSESHAEEVVRSVVDFGSNQKPKDALHPSQQVFHESTGIGYICRFGALEDQDDLIPPQSVSTEQTDTLLTAGRILPLCGPKNIPTANHSKSLPIAHDRIDDNLLTVTSVPEETATQLYADDRDEIRNSDFETPWTTWRTPLVNAGSFSGGDLSDSDSILETQDSELLSEVSDAFPPRPGIGLNNISSCKCSDDFGAGSRPSLDTSTYYNHATIAGSTTDGHEGVELSSHITADVDLMVPVPHVDPKVLPKRATLLRSNGENLSLHRKVLPEHPHLFDLPLCDDGLVPWNRRLCASMHGCLTSDCSTLATLLTSESEDTVTASATEQCMDVKNIAKLPHSARTAFLSSSVVSWKTGSLPAMLLPRSRRTHNILFGRSLGSSTTEFIQPVVLSHAIDISLTRVSHARDTGWDSFETNIRAGMPSGHTVIPCQRRGVRCSSSVAPAEKFSQSSSNADLRISGRLSLPAFPSTLPLERRVVQRPEIYYSTSKKAVVSVKTSSPKDLDSTSRALMPQARQLVQRDRVKAHLAVANWLANDRRMTMYCPKPLVLFNSSYVRSAFAAIPSGGSGHASSLEQSTTPGSRKPVMHKWASITGDANPLLVAQRSSGERGTTPNDVLTELGVSQTDKSNARFAPVNNYRRAEGYGLQHISS